jgi:predicted AAA+ superfamily ATPase
MNRKQLKSLANWLNAEDRKPLIIRGARQIGKSTLARLFAEQRRRQLAEVNLERYPEMNAVFEAFT